VCSALAKQLLGTGQWPELAAFMVQASQAPDPGLRELGMLLLTSVCETLGDKLGHLFGQIKGLLEVALKDPVSQDVRLQAVKALGVVVCLHSHNSSALIFRELVPGVMSTLEEVGVFTWMHRLHRYELPRVFLVFVTVLEAFRRTRRSHVFRRDL
jgi:hypothetical protein